MGCELCKVTNGDIDDLDGATIAIGGAALKETMGFLSKIDLFRSLAQEDLTALARICTKETFNPSDTLVKMRSHVEPGAQPQWLQKLHAQR
jgi:hypothetical protein